MMLSCWATVSGQYRYIVVSISWTRLKVTICQRRPNIHLVHSCLRVHLSDCCWLCTFSWRCKGKDCYQEQFCHIFNWLKQLMLIEWCSTWTSVVALVADDDARSCANLVAWSVSAVSSFRPHVALGKFLAEGVSRSSPWSPTSPKHLQAAHRYDIVSHKIVFWWSTRFASSLQCSSSWIIPSSSRLLVDSKISCWAKFSRFDSSISLPAYC